MVRSCVEIGGVNTIAIVESIAEGTSGPVVVFEMSVLFSRRKAEKIGTSEGS